MCTPLYRAILLAIEKRRQELGWPSDYLDDVAGTQDRYYQKLLHPETPSGKTGRWDTLQLLVSALWPDGVGLCLTRAAKPIANDDTLRQKIRATARRYRKRDTEMRKIPTHLRDYASAKEAAENRSHTAVIKS